MNIFSICIAGLVLLPVLEQDRTDRTAGITMDINLTIGLEDQPAEHQLGQPVAVRTDNEGNIFVADKGSMSIKVFDSQGVFLRTIGRRGRGPGEFQSIRIMDITPDEEIVVADLMNMRYTFFSTDGEVLRNYSIRFESPFAPPGIIYVNGYLIGLQLMEGGNSPWVPLDRLFFAYQKNFRDGMYSFGSFEDLGFDDRFAIRSFGGSPGSIHVVPGEPCFVFSPGLYTGTFYKYCDEEIEGWYLANTFYGAGPYYDSPYVAYSNVEAVPQDRKLPVVIHSRGEQLVGRVKSMNAGIYVLEDGRIVNFYAEWIKGENPSLISQYVLDIRTQIFNSDGELTKDSELLSLYRQGIASPLVNWKDDSDQFYLIGTKDEIPVIKRFTLDF